MTPAGGGRVGVALALSRRGPTFADAPRAPLRTAASSTARVASAYLPASRQGRSDVGVVSSASTASARDRPDVRTAPLGTLVPRTYHYDLDAHGQIFLTGTRHRNFTSNLARDVSFADTFLRRIRRLKAGEAEDADEEYTHVSVCAGEQNLVRIAATPIVFQDLVDDRLTWAGSFTLPFEPERICVSDQGYLFHPSCDVLRSLCADNQTTASVEAPRARAIAVRTLLAAALQARPRPSPARPRGRSGRAEHAALAWADARARHAWRRGRDAGAMALGAESGRGAVRV